MRRTDPPHNNLHQIARVKRNMASQITEVSNAYDATLEETAEAPEYLAVDLLIIADLIEHELSQWQAMWERLDNIECSTHHFDSNQEP